MFPTYGKTSVHRGSYGKKQGNFYVFFYFSGFEKVRRLIISLKGDEKGNFPLSLSVKTPRPPYGASPWNCLFRLRNVQGEQGDCAVKSLTCVREPRRRSRFRSRVSAPLSARNRVKLVWLDFGISNKCRRVRQAIHFYANSVNATVRQYISFSVSNADVHDGRWFGWRGVPIIETEWLLVDKNALLFCYFTTFYYLCIIIHSFLVVCVTRRETGGEIFIYTAHSWRRNGIPSPTTVISSLHTKIIKHLSFLYSLCHCCRHDD